MIGRIIQLVKTLGLYVDDFYSITSESKLFPSDYRKALPSKKADTCWVLGNGPSLSNDLEKYIDTIKKSDIFIVNNFVQSHYYTELKPQYLVIADPAFASNNNSENLQPVIDKFYNALNSKTSWDLTTFIPFQFGNGMEKSTTNSHISFAHFNKTEIKNSGTLSHFLINHNLGMYRCQNVLIPALLLAINCGYKKVNILGADHSWLNDMCVNDSNQVCLRDKHFFDEKNKVPSLKPWLKAEGEAFSMGEIMEALTHKFKQYPKINEYALKKSCKVTNYTSSSFIDAFTRG